MRRAMFSSITIASSTTKPVAMVSAIRVRLLSENPASSITPKVATSDSGTAIEGMIVAGTVRRNTKVTSTTRPIASSSSCCTPLIEARIDSVRSLSTATSTAAGIEARSCGSRAWIRSTTSMVSTWLTSRPPTITRPSGWRSSAPEPEANTIGMAANSAARVVIRIGRKRSRAARWIASRGASPCSRSASRAKSIIMIAFFFTRPISRMMPITAIRSRLRPDSSSAASAPTVAEGRVERMVTGWMKLS